MSHLEQLKETLKTKSREELLEIAQGMTELQRRDDAARGANYVPNGACEKFIDMVGMNRTFINLFAAANGVGKTAVGANIVTNICFGPQNEWFDFALFEKWPYLKRGRIIADTKTVKEKIIPELEKWFPDPSRYTRIKEGQSFYSKWKTDTGFEFDIMTYNQDPKDFESVELGWVWFDEPPPLAIYRASMSRARRGMIAMLTMTPLKHSAWIKNEIVDEADKEAVLGKLDRAKRYITAEDEENCKQHGIRGILEHKDLEKMRAQYPPDELEARTKGKFGHLLGRVHKLFDRKIHAIKPFLLNPRDYATYTFLDPHPRTPDASIWVAVDRKDQMFQVAELYMTGTTAELAHEIKKIEATLGLRVEGRFIDPSAFNEDKHIQENSLAQELRKFGLYYQPGSKELDEGIRLTNEGLSYTAKAGKIVIAPKFFVFENNERTIWEFENYVWDDWRGKDGQDRNPKGKPKDVDDHMMENIHRAFLARIAFTRQVKSNSTLDTVEVKSGDLDPYEN